MANPVFQNNPVFRDPEANRPRARGPQGYAATATAGAQTADAATLEGWYDSPAATTADTKRLTYDDVIMKTGGLLAVLVAAGAVSWALVDTMPALWIGGAVVGLVLGLVNAFKKNPSPALISIYAVAQGLFLGGISATYNYVMDGIVLQAVLGTVSVFAVSLFLYASGKVRVTPKFQRIVLASLIGYAVFSLVNVVLMLFGVGGEGYGPLRSGFVGIIVGLFAVVLAAATLMIDFDSIKRGVQQGVPAKFAWSAAFGLLVTLIWLYLEILRLLAILRGDD